MNTRKIVVQKQSLNKNQPFFVYIHGDIPSHNDQVLAENAIRFLESQEGLFSKNFKYVMIPAATFHGDTVNNNGSLCETIIGISGSNQLNSPSQTFITSLKLENLKDGMTSYPSNVENGDHYITGTLTSGFSADKLGDYFEHVLTQDFPESLPRITAENFNLPQNIQTLEKRFGLKPDTLAITLDTKKAQKLHNEEMGKTFAFMNSVDKDLEAIAEIKQGIKAGKLPEILFTEDKAGLSPKYLTKFKKYLKNNYTDPQPDAVNSPFNNLPAYQEFVLRYSKSRDEFAQAAFDLVKPIAQAIQGATIENESEGGKTLTLLAQKEKGKALELPSERERGEALLAELDYGNPIITLDFIKKSIVKAIHKAAYQYYKTYVKDNKDKIESFNKKFSPFVSIGENNRLIYHTDIDGNALKTLVQDKIQKSLLKFLKSKWASMMPRERSSLLTLIQSRFAPFAHIKKLHELKDKDKLDSSIFESVQTHVNINVYDLNLLALQHLASNVFETCSNVTTNTESSKFLVQEFQKLNQHLVSQNILGSKEETKNSPVIVNNSLVNRNIEFDPTLFQIEIAAQKNHVLKKYAKPSFGDFSLQDNGNVYQTKNLHVQSELCFAERIEELNDQISGIQNEAILRSFYENTHVAPRDTSTLRESLSAYQQELKKFKEKENDRVTVLTTHENKLSEKTIGSMTKDFRLPANEESARFLKNIQNYYAALQKKQKIERLKKQVSELGNRVTQLDKELVKNIDTFSEAYSATAKKLAISQPGIQSSKEPTRIVGDFSTKKGQSITRATQQYQIVINNNLGTATHGTYAMFNNVLKKMGSTTQSTDQDLKELDKYLKQTETALKNLQDAVRELENQESDMNDFITTLAKDLPAECDNIITAKQDELDQLEKLSCSQVLQNAVQQIDPSKYDKETLAPRSYYGFINPDTLNVVREYFAQQRHDLAQVENDLDFSPPEAALKEAKPALADFRTAVEQYAKQKAKTTVELEKKINRIEGQYFTSVLCHSALNVVLNLKFWEQQSSKIPGAKKEEVTQGATTYKISPNIAGLIVKIQQPQFANWYQDPRVADALLKEIQHYAIQFSGYELELNPDANFDQINTRTISLFLEDNKPKYAVKFNNKVAFYDLEKDLDETQIAELAEALTTKKTSASKLSKELKAAIYAASSKHGHVKGASLRSTKELMNWLSDLPIPPADEKDLGDFVSSAQQVVMHLAQGTTSPVIKKATPVHVQLINETDVKNLSFSSKKNPNPNPSAVPGGAPVPPNNPGVQAAANPRKKSKPLYKKWWFWAILVGSLILSTAILAGVVYFAPATLPVIIGFTAKALSSMTISSSAINFVLFNIPTIGAFTTATTVAFGTLGLVGTALFSTAINLIVKYAKPIGSFIKRCFGRCFGQDVKANPSFTPSGQPDNHHDDLNPAPQYVIHSEGEYSDEDTLSEKADDDLQSSSDNENNNSNNQHLPPPKDDSAPSAELKKPEPSSFVESAPEKDNDVSDLEDSVTKEQTEAQTVEPPKEENKGVTVELAKEQVEEQQGSAHSLKNKSGGSTSDVTYVLQHTDSSSSSSKKLDLRTSSDSHQSQSSTSTNSSDDSKSKSSKKGNLDKASVSQDMETLFGKAPTKKKKVKVVPIGTGNTPVVSSPPRPGANKST